MNLLKSNELVLALTKNNYSRQTVPFIQYLQVSRWRSIYVNFEYIHVAVFGNIKRIVGIMMSRDARISVCSNN